MGDVSRGFYITGTDTGVGKTVFTCLMVRELNVAFFSENGRPFVERKATLARVAAYKPVCSGATSREVEALAEPRATNDAHSEIRLGESLALQKPTWSDTESLYAATNAVFPRERLCPQTFLAPLSPPAAAALEGREVDEALLVDGYRWLAEQADIVLVEGAGGFYSPISTNWLNADLAERIGLPVLIVAPNRLGTINQTLLTIEAIRQRGLTVAGVVLNRLTETNDPSTATNAAEIQQRGRVRIWGEMSYVPAAQLQSQRLPESMICELWNFGSEVDG